MHHTVHNSFVCCVFDIQSEALKSYFLRHYLNAHEKKQRKIVCVCNPFSREIESVVTVLFL